MGVKRGWRRRQRWSRGLVGRVTRAHRVDVCRRFVDQDEELPELLGAMPRVISGSPGGGDIKRCTVGGAVTYSSRWVSCGYPRHRRQHPLRPVERLDQDFCRHTTTAARKAGTARMSRTLSMNCGSKETSRQSRPQAASAKARQIRLIALIIRSVCTSTRRNKWRAAAPRASSITAPSRHQSNGHGGKSRRQTPLRKPDSPLAHIGVTAQLDRDLVARSSSTAASQTAKRQRLRSSAARPPLDFPLLTISTISFRCATASHPHR